ncbi:hypothetical protein AB0399_17840 [Streptomyces sp. NPDC088194]|uniref:hypothetical protein n=1 Tax=Streptomyces sp. NPDC088194 TaxID=3154931 RepID=UPI00344DA6E9
MSQLRGFLPWIVFAVVSSLAWQWAALLALALGVLSLVKDRRAGVTADAQILEFGTVAYFGALTAVAFADPHSPLRDVAGGLSSAWLALIAAVTLLVRRPFVLGIAKRHTAPEVWTTPLFRRTCTVLTGAWTIGFTLSAVATLACEAAGSGTLPRVIVQVLGFGLPAAFTRSYVKKVRDRARGSHGSHVPAIAVGGETTFSTVSTAGR